MGHSASSAKAALSQPPTPPGKRDGYLNRLGIQKDARRASSSMASCNAHHRKLHEDKGSEDKSIADTGCTTELTASGPVTPKGVTSKEGISFGNTNEECLDLKAQDDFRVAYLRKLSYEKVWLPPSQRPQRHQTVIVFDWDDTLLCTSFLHHNENPRMGPVLKRMEVAAKSILEHALRLGRTYIITNAMEGWVEYSAARYLPGLLPVLEKIQVISARSRYEALYPGDVSKWKKHAFLDLQREMGSEVIANLNSIGDADYEMDAARVMGKEFTQARVKTIKLRDNPSPQELLKELELVASSFERIVESAQDLKVGLERKPE